MKTRRLLKEEYEARLEQKKCPHCRQHNLIQKQIDQAYGKLKPHTVPWVCGGPFLHECYYLIDPTSETLFESAEGTSPVDIETKPPEPHVPRVIRRPRHTGKKYQPQHAR